MAAPEAACGAGPAGEEGAEDGCARPAPGRPGLRGRYEPLQARAGFPGKGEERGVIRGGPPPAYPSEPWRQGLRVLLPGTWLEGAPPEAWRVDSARRCPLLAGKLSLYLLAQPGALETLGGGGGGWGSGHVVFQSSQPGGGGLQPICFIHSFNTNLRNAPLCTKRSARRWGYLDDLKKLILLP